MVCKVVEEAVEGEDVVEGAVEGEDVVEEAVEGEDVVEEVEVEGEDVVEGSVFRPVREGEVEAGVGGRLGAGRRRIHRPVMKQQ